MDQTTQSSAGRCETQGGQQQRGAHKTLACTEVPWGVVCTTAKSFSTATLPASPATTAVVGAATAVVPFWRATRVPGADTTTDGDCFGAADGAAVSLLAMAAGEACTTAAAGELSTPPPSASSMRRGGAGAPAASLVVVCGCGSVDEGGSRGTQQ